MTARQELSKDNIAVSEIYPYITNTNFGRNRATSGLSSLSADYSLGDDPAFIADLVIKAIDEGESQYFANDRIKSLANGGN